MYYNLNKFPTVLLTIAGVEEEKINFVLSQSGENMYFLVKYSFGLFVIMWQFFIHCHFGNAITEWVKWILKWLQLLIFFHQSASLRVAEGAYNSAWYKASPKYRKMVLQIMMRAQREQKFRALNFGDINMETYYWVSQLLSAKIFKIQYFWYFLDHRKRLQLLHGFGGRLRRSLNEKPISLNV
jgi:hypothetical protein